MTPILQVQGLRVSVGPLQILHGVDLELMPGQTLGVVGESGCGKSMTGQAILRMLPTQASVQGSIRFEGTELLTLPEKRMRDIRGAQIALVMQDPFTALNPTMRVGEQIAEAIWLHQAAGRAEARRRAVDMLRRVGIPSPEASARKYPHQMSGGQRQRVVLAMAFACRPKVLIADEPTTALDVTLQASILRLIQELKETENTAVLLISHDVGVIGALASRVAVFYAGRIVESGSAEQVLHAPGHPYTRALLGALPMPGRERLQAIEGQPPDFAHLPPGCPFTPRCPYRIEICDQAPSLDAVEEGHAVACWRASEALGASASL